MNALVFLVPRNDLAEYFNLRDAIGKEKKRNESYYLAQRTGRGYLVLARDTTCGLYDSWNGSGSCTGNQAGKRRPPAVPMHCLC